MNALARDPAVSTLRALVIGYGNPLRGDDAVGWLAAEALAATPAIASDPLVSIEMVHQLAPELAQEIASADQVFFVDAALATQAEPPGTLACREVRSDTGIPDSLGHFLTPGHALAYASAVFGASPRAWIASVTAESFDYGAPPSPPVAAALPALVQWLRTRILEDPGQ